MNAVSQTLNPDTHCVHKFCPFGIQGVLPYGQWTVLLATTTLWAPRALPSTRVLGAPSERGLVHAASRTADPVLQDTSTPIP